MQLIPDNIKSLCLSRKGFHETSKSRRYLQNMYFPKKYLPFTEIQNIF